MDTPDSGTSLDITDTNFQSQAVLSIFSSSTLTTGQNCVFYLIILALARYEHRPTDA